MIERDGSTVAADLHLIMTLKARYFRFIDTKQWGPFRALFLPEARFDFTDPTYGTGRAFDNADDFVDWVQTVFEGARTVHHGHMPEIEIAGDGLTAHGVWAMYDIVDQPQGEPLRRAGLLEGAVEEPIPPVQGYGHYHEEYVKVEGGWLFSSVRLTRLRIDPYG
jgi:hypothetical protein